MADKDEIIRRIDIGRAVGKLIAVPEVQDAYRQSVQVWKDQLCTCDPRDTTAMVLLRGMIDGVQAFWGALEGLRELGADAEAEAAGRPPVDAGRGIL